MPPSAWTPNTSSVSSTRSMRLSPFTPHRQASPPTKPIASAPPGPTKPQAGVIATSPDTAPDAAPSVVVAYTDDPEIRSGAKFKKRGIQVAAGVPLMCGEGDDFSTFRIGLFGLDKLTDVDGTVERLEARLG